MNCFERLVKSHFMANVSAELEEARERLKAASISSIPPVIYANPKDRKALYDDYVYEFYLKEEMEETILDEDEKDLIYMFQHDDMMYVFSQSKSQLQESLRYSYDLSGILPLHCSRHKVKGKVFFTALFDRRLTFESISPN